MITNKGRLAICEAESTLREQHFHNEIWESFKILKEKGLIKILDRNPGRGKLMGKGMPRNYYTVTEYGLVALIKEGLEPREFWNALIFYSSGKSKHDHRWDRIGEIYESYLQQYLTYSTGFDYNIVLQLDHFNTMCKEWIVKNTRNGLITLDQKILEILALAGSPSGITMEEISARSKEGPEKVRKVLRQYTPILSYETSFLMEEDMYSDESAVKRELIETILRNIITIHISNEVENYSLSLFGVMLVLTLIRYNNMKRLNLYLLGNYSIQEAFDKVASGYKDKLPFIFGLWDTLEDIMKVLSVYNFDGIIDRQARSKFLETPVVMGGNKEYYEGYQGVAMYNRKQMMDLYDAGISALTGSCLDIEDKENNKRYWENPKTVAIYKKLTEIGVLLGYHSNPGRSERPITDSKVNPSDVHDIKSVPTTWMLERSFAHEITFLYYLYLNSDMYVPALFPQDDYYLMAGARLFSNNTSEEFWSRPADEYSLAPQVTNIVPKSPRERLVAILKKRRQVKEWFSDCINNSIQFRNTADEVMSTFYRDIK